MSHLGDIYSMGMDAKKDIKKAIAYYEEAAKQNDISAQYNYAVLLISGTDIPTNYRLAEALFHRAATQGHVPAMVNLAQLYSQGCGLVPKSLDLAAKWLKLAAPYDLNAKELLKRSEAELLAEMHTNPSNK